MVGFPGETETIYEQMLEFIEWAEFEHLGYSYSVLKQEPARKTQIRCFPGYRRRRRAQLMAAQARISRKKNLKMVGKVFPVLMEGPCPETDLLLVRKNGRNGAEVDRRVLINEGVGHLGEIMPVRITEAHDYDVVGEIVEPPI